MVKQKKEIRMGFHELSRKLSPTIKRIAYKLNGRYRSFGHDDLYQEAMLHLWVDFDKGKLSDKTDSYILQGCYFHLKNYIRKVNERPNVISLDAQVGEEGKTELRDFLFLPAQDGDCRDSLHIRLLAESVLNNGFSPRERTVLIAISEGLTTRDIGRRLGVSHVSIVKIIASIRRKAMGLADN